MRLSLTGSFPGDVGSAQSGRDRGDRRTGENLKLTIVAEGVESGEQADFLRRIGCDLIQGYYYSPPLMPTAFAELRCKQNQEFES